MIPSRLLAVLGVLAFRWSGSLVAQDHKTALLAAERASAELSKDSGLAMALGRALQPGAVVLWPGAPVVMGAGVDRFLSALPRRDSLGLTWQPLGIRLSRDSTLGVTWGVVVATGAVVSGSPRVGRYLSVRTRDGERWNVTALLFQGFPVPPGPPPSGLPLTRTAISPSGASGPFVRADRAFARLAADSGAAVAFRRWAAPDALIFGGGGLLTRGPDAIGQAVAGPAQWRWHPVAAGASESGDLGWTVGEAVITPEAADPDYSKYLTVWTRLFDGSIRFIHDGGNPRPQAP